jgi:integrase
MAREKRKRRYGAGTVYRRGDSWAVRWRENGQRRYKGGFASRELAEAVRQQIERNVLQGKLGIVEEAAPGSTLEALAQDWLTRRKKTHRAARDDGYRWKNHLAAHFGRLHPPDVNEGAIRRFVEAKLAAGLNPATVGHCVRLLSTFFADLVEDGHAPSNPVRALAKRTRRLMRPTVDPKKTPFLERPADIARVFQALPAPVNVAFAVGALAGLRTGEVLGLSWNDVDLGARRLTVRHQVTRGRLAGLKDDECRAVLILDALQPILAAYKLATGGGGLLFPATRGGGRPGRPATFMRHATLHAKLKAALTACKLPEGLTWYQVTRHTFASQWVLAGHPLERLSKLLGHSTMVVTERYAHLRPDLFPEQDYSAIAVDLQQPDGQVVRLRRAKNEKIGYRLGTNRSRKGNKEQRKAQQ